MKLLNILGALACLWATGCGTRYMVTEAQAHRPIECLSVIALVVAVTFFAANVFVIFSEDPDAQITSLFTRLKSAL